MPAITGPEEAALIASIERENAAELEKQELEKHKKWSKALVDGAIDVTRYMELVEIRKGRMQRNAYSFMKQIILLQSNVATILDQTSQGKDSNGYLLNILSQANKQLYKALKLGNSGDPKHLERIYIECIKEGVSHNRVFSLKTLDR